MFRKSPKIDFFWGGRESGGGGECLSPPAWCVRPDTPAARGLPCSGKETECYLIALEPHSLMLMLWFGRFYATGGFYQLIGDSHGPSKSTVCRAVHRVTSAICSRLSSVIAWPEDLAVVKQAFFDKAGMRDVIGEPLIYRPSCLLASATFAITLLFFIRFCPSLELLCQMPRDCH